MGNCDWGQAGEAERLYHDREWGVPIHDDRRMFEALSLDCLQCGLSWSLMLKKRAIFRRCFAEFDYDQVAAFTDEQVQRILETPGMLRSERKVRAIVANAACFRQVRAQFGSFCAYLWGFTDGKTVVYEGHPQGRVPVRNGLSERISRDLKKRGFRFVGPVMVYGFLQGCGVINDHGADCPCFARINGAFPTVELEPEGEVF